jgi:hypothetical protein
MLKEDTWIFAVPDPAVVDIDLATHMKRALITENYGVQKSAALRMEVTLNHNYPS